MLDKSVSREGTLLMKGGEVFLDGWEIHPGGMCREVAILACMYAARRLLDHASRLTLEGGSAPVISDMPPETPREWLCPKTLEFDAAFDRLSDDEQPDEPFPLLP
jgi:hypothetical protein